ncbi:CotS family spore coat protein [Cellulosilyticum sp. I15G10I2]|uniref:CotS family spore coat protein n=1 Tax=Cellulosilyticum sp. I15G10I2 TaxID=1892843 RepID=UPI00085C7FD5|nr:CotS family spore coat protein [Cellulosilyticum sp. I15G10I2]
MRPLNKEIISQYDISVRKYQYIRSAYYLETNKGKFLLRKVDLPKDQIIFDYEVDTHLKHSNFKSINAIYTTKKRVPYAVFGEQCYIMQGYIEGEETDFKNFEDLKNTIYVLAEFHRAAKNVSSKVKDIDKISIKNIYDYYTKRNIQNTKLKKSITALKQKSKFEILFLDHCDAYTCLEQMALGGINRELADRLVRRVKDEQTIAHKDYTYHTVNKTSMGQYMINNLDTCSYDIQIIDLAYILGRIMQKNDWNIEILYELIKAYDSRNTLLKEEFEVLKAMMIYPEKYNSICTKYLGSKRRWNYNMFEQKWQNMIVYMEHQIEAAKIINSW